MCLETKTEIVDFPFEYNVYFSKLSELTCISMNNTFQMSQVCLILRATLILCSMLKPGDHTAHSSPGDHIYPYPNIQPPTSDTDPDVWMPQEAYSVNFKVSHVV